MFEKKIRKNFLTATDSFVVEMLRAVLKDMLHTEIYLTQVSIRVEKMKKPTEKLELFPLANGILELRPCANAISEIEVEAFFTSLDFPRPHGHELPHGGVLPALPNVSAKIVLTNDANGFYNWELWTMDVAISNTINEPATMTTMKYWFDDEAGTMKFPAPRAPMSLMRLSKELQHRGPSRFRNDE